ncbi:MAG TPA: hypothetical protein VFG10_18370 [Saprospiraceae bacterium]|nr:hypothetical protein [Saprospiraceae bacterium]
MKKLIFISITLSLLPIFSTHAQDVLMTFSTGMSPQQTPATHYIFVNRSSPRNEFTFDLAQVKASYYIGFGAKYDVEPFFFAAEAQYNRREYIYNIAYTFPGFGRSEQTELLTESMNVINVPLTLGVDLGIVDVTSGFLPQVILSQDSDLRNLDGYNQELKWLRFGWHTGLAANIGSMRAGLSMQMDFNNYADHAFIRDQSLSLQGRSTRMLGTLSYQF